MCGEQQLKMDRFAILAILLAGLLSIYAQNYCNVCPNHTMCLYKGVGLACKQRKYGDVKDMTKKKIVDIHNRYRRKVAKGQEKSGDPGPQPPAADMCLLRWDNELAKVAQRWVDQCTFAHDKCRNVARFQWVGQNLFISGRWNSNGIQANDTQDWEDAISSWYNEVTYLNNKNVEKFSSYKSKQQTGHYTALVWGTTCLVGCGFTTFVQTKDGKDWFQKYYGCNYGPGGNIQSQKVYSKGTACSRCPKNSKCQDGLCVVP